MENAIMQVLQIISFLGVILGIEVLVNTLTGILYNTNQEKQEFSWKKLLKGLIKAMVFYLSISALAIAFTLLPFVNDMIIDVFGIELISTDTLNTLSSVSILGLIIGAIIIQGKKALEGIAELLEIKVNKE